MDSQRRIFPRILFLVVGVAFVSLPTFAAAEDAKVSDEKIVRMNEMVAELVPWGKIMDMMKSADPKWPLNEHSSKVSPEQLSCLREQLSSENINKRKLEDVKAYAAANPEQFDSDYKLLDTGFAPLFGKFFMAGVDQARTGEKPDMAAIMSGASNAQMMAMTMFLYESKYKGLRDLTGLGDLLGIGSGQDQKERGQNVGRMLVMGTMMKAMDACSINAASLMGGAGAPAEPPIQKK